MSDEQIKKDVGDDLVDFDEDEDEAPGAEEVAEKEVNKGHFVGVHSSGFRDMALKPDLVRAITEAGFEHPSEVQATCIPHAIMGMDIICQAKAGMGKTATFVLPTLHQLEPVAGEVHIIVVCHARELAYQISKDFNRFCKFMPDVSVATIFGGSPIAAQKTLLRDNPPNIVVGTPGRLNSLIKDGSLNLSSVKHFVIDECDQVLNENDMRMDVQCIFMKCPAKKQVMVFSATIPESVKPVLKLFTKDAMEVYVDDETKLTLHGLQQYFLELEEAEKNRRLKDLLDTLEFNQVIIFVSKVKRAKELDRLLRELAFPTIAITSGLKQEERLRRYEAFKNFEHRILVATDLMGKGIDIEKVNVVINYDFPSTADSYMHRVGRAGRFGTKGVAISFAATAEEKETLATVQSRFAAKVEPLPDTIDRASYM